MNGFEKIRADNPLLIPLGEYVNSSDWAKRLANDPLDGIPFDSLTFQDRDLLLSDIRVRFEPTNKSIEIATTIQSMLWRRYVDWNPIFAENRARTMQLLGQRGKTINALPWLPGFASALIIEGCTGTGKSATVARVVRAYQQQYYHEECVAAQWRSQMQVVFLVVPMQTHKSGLLYAILGSIDAATGSSWRIQYSDTRRWPVDKLAVEVGILLIQHFVGVLIIEEVQPKNFSVSPNLVEMQLFLLRLMNFGIPIVMVGNPLGFIGIDDFSQDLRRFTDRDPIHLYPPALEDEEWSTGIGPGIWQHNVMPEPTPWSEEISKALYSVSGGIPSYVGRATESVQRIALRERGCQAVALRHFDEYRRTSSAFLKNKDLIEGFAERNPKKLMRFIDVPWEDYGIQWGKLTPSEIVNGTSGQDSLQAMDPQERKAYGEIHARLRAGITSQATRKKNKNQKNAAVRRKLEPSDIRAGSVGSLVEGLAVLEQHLKGERRSGPDDLT